MQALLCRPHVLADRI